MRLTSHALGLIIVSALAFGVAAADDFARVPREQIPAQVIFDENDPTLQTPPAPEGHIKPADPTVFAERPGIQFIVRGGADGFISSDHSGAAATAAAMMFLQGGDMEVLIRGQASGVIPNAFDQAEGGLRIERRFPIDDNLNFWWGLGGNIEGRYSKNPAIDSFFRAQPMALLGVMHAFKPQECVAYFFVKGAIGLVDTQTAGTRFLDKYMRPAVGAEGYAKCDHWRVFVDFQHIFDLGSPGSTDKALLEVSKTWPVNGWLELGVFGKADYTSERAPSIDRAIPEILPGTTRNIGRVQGGLEVRY